MEIRNMIDFYHIPEEIRLEDIETSKPKYLEQINKDVTLRDNYKFLKKVTGNLDRRYGDDYY